MLNLTFIILFKGPNNPLQTKFFLLTTRKLYKPLLFLSNTLQSHQYHFISVLQFPFSCLLHQGYFHISTLEEYSVLSPSLRTVTISFKAFVIFTLW